MKFKNLKIITAAALAATLLASLYACGGGYGSSGSGSGGGVYQTPAPTPKPTM